jgi:hypothetical protein
VPRRRRKRGPQLTPEQRRQEVVDLLAAALADMPAALALADGADASTPPTSPPDGGPENSQESSQKALELSAEKRLSVSGYGARCRFGTGGHWH